MLTPRNWAIKISRANPTMRDKEIKNETVKAERTIDIECFI